ncbi:MAG: thioesterase [Woeseia sp.]|nr:thioesterase [Woeseia sp.]|tara:strand:+ start:1416 stop:1907 length:492 start_codon:yes stop_codon:yes gene_type:complete
METIGTRVGEGIVLSDWIDINQHMNVAYYVLAFDLAIDDLWATFGISEDYIEKTRSSTFGVECHVSYLQELHQDDKYIVTQQILAYDEKRIHHFQRLYHAEKYFLSATAEWMNLHVDLDARRVTPWPSEILERIGEFCDAQAGQIKPAEVGRQMMIRRPIYQL